MDGQLRRTLFLVTAAVITAAGVPLAGARPAQTPQQLPQFRGGTDIVPVDFLASGSNGMPVTDLTVKDIRPDGWIQVEVAEENVDLSLVPVGTLPVRWLNAALATSIQEMRPIIH